MTGQEILDLQMGENDAGAATIRDYLKALLTNLWNEGEGFSSKRPFGNGGWEYDLKKALAKNNAIESSYNAKWEEWQYDQKEADEAIFDAIEAL